MLDSNLVRDWCKIEWWDVLVQPHFEIENKSNMVSSSLEEEKQKNLKYEF